MERKEKGTAEKKKPCKILNLVPVIARRREEQRKRLMKALKEMNN